MRREDGGVRIPVCIGDQAARHDFIQVLLFLASWPLVLFLVLLETSPKKFMQAKWACKGEGGGWTWGGRGRETRVLALSLTTTHNLHTSAFHKVRPLLKLSPQKPTAHPCLRFVCAFPRSFHPPFRCHRPAPSGGVRRASSSFDVPGDPSQAFPRCKKLLTGASMGRADIYIPFTRGLSAGSASLFCCVLIGC